MGDVKPTLHVTTVSGSVFNCPEYSVKYGQVVSCGPQ